MTTLLVLVLSLLLLGGFGLAVMAALEWVAGEQRRRHARAAALVAEIDLQRLTRQSMQQLLDELKKHPGKIPVTVKLF